LPASSGSGGRFPGSGTARRVLQTLLSVALTFLGLTMVTFFIGRVMPIDPVLAIVGSKASNETYDRVRAEMGLDLPLPVQYWRYLEKVLHGDFGTSVITSQPVLRDMLNVFPATLELAVPALVIGVVLGVPLGVVAATHRGRWQDHLIRLLSLFGYSMPVFWLGLVGLLLFYAKLGWVEGPGRIDVGYEDMVPTVTGLLTVDALLDGDRDVFIDALRHLVLPASILGYLSLAYVARMTRSFMLEQLRQEYVLTALAKGLEHWRVVWVHALGNVWVQLITVIALTFGSLLEGAVLTETVFSWPGLGLYMKNSLFNADLNAVLGGTMLVGVVYILLNLVSDLLYPLVDPRARDRT
jgi:peptide/nickel transport system permease protein